MIQDAKKNLAFSKVHGPWDLAPKNIFSGFIPGKIDQQEIFGKIK